MVRWRKKLSSKNCSKLQTQGSRWERDGGNIIWVGLRHGKTARRNEKLSREREARFKAEQAAYEARCILAAPIKDRKQKALRRANRLGGGSMLI